MAIRIALRGAGYQVSEAADGLDGLTKASQARFDMIVADVRMPHMDGMEMLHEIRKLTIQKDTPVVFLTAEADEAVKHQAQSAGASGWLAKPFVPEQLLRLTSSMLCQ
jgi:two-component system chemotaxis response regulator CheY